MPPQWEIGLGRERVLSPEGRDEAAMRWYEGDRGPDSAMAQAAPATCSTCGFMEPIGGLLGQLFAACANEYSPADGTLVSVDYGCGGHSSIPPAESASLALGDAVIDHVAYDAVDVTAALVGEGSGSLAADAEATDPEAEDVHATDPENPDAEAVDADSAAELADADAPDPDGSATESAIASGDEEDETHAAE